MAVKKSKPVEEIAQIEPVCANCEHHAADGQCLLAAMAGQFMHITSHAGVLMTDALFGCNQFEGKE